MPLAYSHTTFGEAKAQLAALLNDPAAGLSFYSDAEVGTYIVEALRFFGAAAAFWRDRDTFVTNTNTGIPPAVTPTADNPWYDLPTWLPGLRGYNVIDSQILQAIEYHLLEPATVPYSGSSQFSQAAIVAAMQRRLNQFLLETTAVLTHMQIGPLAPNSGRITLPDNVMYVRRGAWFDTATAQWSRLSRSDEWSMLGYYQPPWTQQTPVAPQVFSLAVTPALTLQLAPPPTDPGFLDLIVVQSGTALNPVDPITGVLMGIPDDFTWVVKFGALAELLNADGPAKDPRRAAYCQARWQEGIAMARVAESVLFLSIQGNPQYSESLASVDYGRPLWQNYAGNPPFMGALDGLNLLAMVDPPAGAFPVTLDVVQNAIVPSADGDFIQVGREELAAILGYAEHLATFKCGGAEFMATLPSYQRIMALAGTYNSKLKAVTQPALYDRSTLEVAARPPLVPVS